MIFHKEVKQASQSHTARILNHLKKVGHYGAWNYELAQPHLGGLAWHRRITDLRKEGYNISRERQLNGGQKYFLNLEEK